MEDIGVIWDKRVDLVISKIEKLWGIFKAPKLEINEAMLTAEY